MDSHVQSGNRVVAAVDSTVNFARVRNLFQTRALPINTFHYFGILGLAMLLVGESVDVSGKTGRGGGVDTCDMVIYSDLAKCQFRLALGVSRQDKWQHTCLPTFRVVCLSKWTRSGGPNSRRRESESVRASTDSWRISSVIL